MANIFPAGPGDNEGVTTDWTITFGTATPTNSALFAQTGSQSLKVVAGAGSTAKVMYDTYIAVSAGTSLSTIRYERGSAAVPSGAFIDWYTSGNSYISTTTLDNGGNLNTSAFDQRLDTSVAPGTTAKFKFGFQIDFTTIGQIAYYDAITIDDGSSGATNHGIPPGFF